MIRSYKKTKGFMKEGKIDAITGTFKNMIIGALLTDINCKKEDNRPTPFCTTMPVISSCKVLNFARGACKIGK